MSEVSHRARLDSVQVLRGLAALDVVFAHLPLFRHPVWGVDMFFIISGFIMVLVTAKSPEHFFLKRVIRVVPLYWLGTLAVFTIAIVAPNLVKNTSSDVIELLKSLAFIPFRKGDGVQPVLFLGWTLNYEMFFYLIFALSMAINHRLRGWLCSLTMIGLFIAGCFINTESIIFNFYTNDMILEFAMGIGCYGVYIRARDWSNRGRGHLAMVTMLGLSGLMLVAWIALWQGLGLTLRPIVYGLPCAAAFMAVLQLCRNVPMPRFLVMLGDASYSLYLFHPYLIILFRKVFPSLARPSLQGYALSLIAAGLCCVMAIICYRVFEAPLTTWLRKVLISRSSAKTVGQGL